jgi:hypothetical protein
VVRTLKEGNNPWHHPTWPLRKYINEKEKYSTREFLRIDHQRMILHAL